MYTIALIGADGAGKTTVGHLLEAQLPTMVKYLYMGVNLDSSNLVLPSTRLFLEFKRMMGKRPDMSGPPDPTRPRRLPKNRVKRLISGIKSSLRLVNRLAEEWFRQLVAWNYHRRGYIVIFDRHFYSDYFASDIYNNDPEKPLTRRIHGFLLEHLYPKPDLVILLDAPAEVLFARKGEGTLELLNRRRQDYLLLGQHLNHFYIVDASQPMEVVVNQIKEIIVSFDQKLKQNLEIQEVRQ